MDIDPEKVKRALELGASEGRETAAGMELDAAIEAVGLSQTVDMAIRSVRKGGKVSLIGNFSPKAEIPLQVVVTRELTLYGSCSSQGDYERESQPACYWRSQS